MTATRKVRSKTNSGFAEVRARIEAASSNSARALLGEMDPVPVLEGNVRLLERALLHLHVLEEETA